MNQTPEKSAISALSYTLAAQLRTRELTRRDFEVRPVPDGHRLAGVGAAALAARLADNPNWAGLHQVPGVALVDVCEDMPGLLDRKVERIVPLALYYSEVVTPRLPSAEAIQLRTDFLRETGYLVLGADECLAVEWGGTPAHQAWRLSHAWENDGSGNVRMVHDHTRELSAAGAAPSIRSLHRHATNRAIESTVADIAAASHANLQTRAARLRRTLALLEAHLDLAEPERTAAGAVIERSFISNGDTSVAFAHLRVKDGWITYPTRNDAWYCGTLINAVTKQVATYCEGDFTLTTCDTPEQFEAELADMANFHGRSRSYCAIGFDEHGSTAFFDTLTLLKGDVAEIRLDPDAPAKNADGEWNVPLFGHLLRDHPIVQGLQPGHSAALPKAAFTLDLLNPAAFRPFVAILARRGDHSLALTVSIDHNTYAVQVPSVKQPEAEVA